MVAHTCHQRVVRLRRLRAWDGVRHRLRARAGLQVTVRANRFSLVCDQGCQVYRMQPSTISMARADWYMAYVVYNQGCILYNHDPDQGCLVYGIRGIQSGLPGMQSGLPGIVRSSRWCRVAKRVLSFFCVVTNFPRVTRHTST